MRKTIKNVALVSVLAGTMLSAHDAHTAKPEPTCPVLTQKDLKKLHLDELRSIRRTDEYIVTFVGADTAEGKRCIRQQALLQKEENDRTRKYVADVAASVAFGGLVLWGILSWRKKHNPDNEA